MNTILLFLLVSSPATEPIELATDFAAMSKDKASLLVGKPRWYRVRPIPETEWPLKRHDGYTCDDDDAPDLERIVWLPRGTKVEKVMTIRAVLRIEQGTVNGRAWTEYILVPADE